MEIPNFFGEATVGVGFEYVLLRSCSLLIFEQILQNKVGAEQKGEVWRWRVQLCDIFQVSVLKDQA